MKKIILLVSVVLFGCVGYAQAQTSEKKLSRQERKEAKRALPQKLFFIIRLTWTPKKISEKNSCTKQLIRKYRSFNCLVQNLHYMVQNAGDMLAISSTILFFAIIVVKFLLRVFNNSKNIWQMKTGSKCWELLG